MTSPLEPEWPGCRFRANPALELVLFDRLSAAERQSYAALRDEPDFYGLLRSRSGRGGVKSVDRETALLFWTLDAQPGPLPSYLAQVLAGDQPATVARLVADGVLEVERDGVFVSGAPAFADLLPATPLGGGRVAELSAAGLRYGQALVRAGFEEPRGLAERLYAYNRLPPGSKRGEPFPDLDTHWPDWQVPEKTSHWCIWRPRHRPPFATAGRYKLYVSPLPRALGPVLGEIAASLRRHETTELKVGDLLRPDKLVAYFAGFEPLAAAAAELERRLAGLPAQGVPFTAPIDLAGLLSWGFDPPLSAQSAVWQGRESWRFWICNRLARALLDAHRDGAAEPARFALLRLGLEGVEAATWTPGSLRREEMA
jgi:hypothetical protein